MSLWNPSGSNWDTAANWGTAPILAVAATASDTTLHVQGLGAGVIPAGAVFFIAGTLYSLTADATVVSGTADFLIDPPLAASALIHAAITDYNVLCTDADLTAQDSTAVGLAKRIVDPASGKTAYDSKRALVKRDIASWLDRREMSASGVLYPWQFNRAAVLLELAYIYADLSRRNEGIANEKGRMYTEMYQAEIEGLKFDWRSVAQPAEALRTRSTAVMWRA